MKQYFWCPICCKEDGHPLNSCFAAGLNDDDISEYECPRGHKFAIVSRNDKYRIIFDEAIIQLQDGFYNNAVLNAYTALEEFMKFIIKFNLFNKGKNIKEILNIIKIIKSSENKKGAFIITLYQDYNFIVKKSYLEEFSSLRNKIIHDGSFIDYDLSYSYCKKIYNFINKILEKTNEIFTEEDYIKFDFAIQNYFNEVKQNVDHIVATAGPSILKRLGINSAESFDKEYEIFKETKKYAYNNPLKSITIKGE